MKPEFQIQKVWFLPVFWVLAWMLTCPTFTYAQKIKDQIKITPIQGLNFGGFFRTGTGGTVTVSYDGIRTVTGGIIQTNLGGVFCPAIFEISGKKGTVVNLLNGSDVTLTGSKGGSVLLHLEAANTGPVFTITLPKDSPSTTTIQVIIGATLTVGSILDSPDGSYSGNIYVTFIQQ